MELGTEVKSRPEETIFRENWPIWILNCQINALEGGTLRESHWGESNTLHQV